MTKTDNRYYFQECGLTIWMTADQYLGLRQRFQTLADWGSPVAAARLQAFGPAPVKQEGGK